MSCLLLYALVLKLHDIAADVVCIYNQEEGSQFGVDQFGKDLPTTQLCHYSQPGASASRTYNSANHNLRFIVYP